MTNGPGIVFLTSNVFSLKNVKHGCFSPFHSSCSQFSFFVSMQYPCTLCVIEIKGSLDSFLEIRTQTPPKHWRSSSMSVHCSAWHCSSDPSLDRP